MTNLTDRQHQMLAFEHRWWRYAGAKEQAIRTTFGVNSTRYHQELNQLIDTEAALAVDPLTVRRLQRLRQQRRVSLNRRGA